MPHVFTARLEWTGAAKGAASDPVRYSRDLEVSFGASVLPMSAAPAYRGDAARANPEQLLIASLSACQALTYLFLAARNHVPVATYTDDADGELGMAGGVMKMVRVTLRPRIALGPGADPVRARALIDDAHHQCFVSNSVTTPITIEPEFTAT